jgi:hypothetical protein
MARGRQLKVYLHPDDHPAVFSRVQDELDAAVLRERAGAPEDFEVGDAPEKGPGRLLCPRSLTGGLRPRHIEVRDEWILDAGSSPVVEWWFSKLDKGFLHPGRLYWVPGDPDPGADDATSSRELASFANRLFTWMRSYTVRFEAEWGPERVGPLTAERLRDGDIALRRNPPGSSI